MNNWAEKPIVFGRKVYKSQAMGEVKFTNELTIIEHQGVRVLTTQQLAQAYECSPINIQQNYNNHQERFVEGKDFYKLEGAELKEFKRVLDNIEDPSIKFASVLILWTERGANRHCKILDTDKAWQQFDVLEDTYFKAKTGVIALPQMSQLQIIAAIAQAAADQELRITAVERTITAVKDTIVRRDNWRESINDMVNKIVESLPNKDYQNIRADTYRALEERAGCDLGTRLRNLRQRMEEKGATKTKINTVTKMDVVEADPKLKEIYAAVIKEMFIKHVT